MYLPKSDVYNSLKELGCFVSQTQPDVFNELPAIIFRIDNNSIECDLDNEINSQDLTVIIDIWAEDSVTASKMLSDVEKIMRKNYYNMSFSGDIPNIGNVFHINCRFTKIYG